MLEQHVEKTVLLTPAHDCLARAFVDHEIGHHELLQPPGGGNRSPRDVGVSGECQPSWPEQEWTARMDEVLQLIEVRCGDSGGNVGAALAVPKYQERRVWIVRKTVPTRFRPKWYWNARGESQRVGAPRGPENFS